MIVRKLALGSVVVVGLGTAAVANAQAPSWGGFYLDGAIGARNTNTNVNTNEVFAGPPQVTVNVNSDGIGQTNFLGEFSGGWRWAGPVVVGVGAFVDLASDDAGIGNTSLKQKSRYGVSVDVAPNWRTHPYAKLTYAWSKIEQSFGLTNCSTWTSSDTYSGWGIGAGVRHLQTNNLYFFGEFVWQDYGSKTESFNLACTIGANPAVTSKVSPQNVVGVVGVGWKF